MRWCLRSWPRPRSLLARRLCRQAPQLARARSSCIVACAAQMFVLWEICLQALRQAPTMHAQHAHQLSLCLNSMMQLEFGGQHAALLCVPKA